MLRIISGFLKGRKLVDSSKLDLRPTTDRNRQALFNIIESGKFTNDFNLKDAKVLDLCSGTGAFAIEAISRGAKNAICVEKNKDHADLARKNSKKLEIEHLIDIKNIDANNLSSLKGHKLDLVFIDPPYSLRIDKMVNSLIVNELLKVESLVIIESDKEVYTDLLKKIDSRKYGISWFSFYNKLSSSD